MIKGERLFLAFVVFMLAAAGCQTVPHFGTAQNPEASMGRYRTFAVLQPADRFSSLEPELLRQLSGTVTNTVIALLQERGYRLSQPIAADFVVFVRGKLIPSQDITELGFIPEFGRLGWARKYPYQYGYTFQDELTFRENVLIVEVYDNSVKKMVWVGWTVLPNELPEQRKPSEIVQGLQRILSQFPRCAVTEGQTGEAGFKEVQQ